MNSFIYLFIYFTFLAVQCSDSGHESRLGLCRKWEQIGGCLKHVNLMKRYCRKTCNMCGE